MVITPALHLTHTRIMNVTELEGHIIETLGLRMILKP